MRSELFLATQSKSTRLYINFIQIIMNKLLILLAFSLPLGLFAQYISSANTIYMIPPTSGCNGQWAILDTAYTSGFCQGVAYNINPIGCASFNSRNGDTLFLDLCSIPCDYVSINPNGNVCMICNIDFTTSSNNISTKPEANIYPNPNNGVFTIEYQSFQKQTLFITDLTGKIVHQEILNTDYTTQKIVTKNLSKGLYLVVIKKETGEIIKSSKMSITH